MQIPVRLVRSDRETTSRRGEPLTFGVPLPRGAVHSESGWRLTGAAGQSVDADVRVTDRWADGSIRWALVDVRCDVGAPFELAHLDVPERGADAALYVGIRLTERPDGLDLDTGAAIIQIRMNGAVPFEQVIVRGEPVLESTRSGLLVTDQVGVTHPVRVQRIMVEHASAARVCVRVDGALDLAGRTVETETRVECYAELATIRVRGTIRNPDAARHPGNFWDLGDPGSVLLKDVSVVMTRPPAGPRTVRASFGDGLDWIDASEPFELYQDSSGGDAWQSSNHLNRARVVPNTFRGYRVRAAGLEHTGHRATPVVWLDDGVQSIGVAVSQFWQNCPKAIEAVGGALIVRLFPGQYADLHELQGGEQKTHEWFLAVDGDGVSSEPLAWARARTLACVDPAWAIASEAIDFLDVLEPGHCGVVDAAIEGAHTFEAKREVIDEYGWRHFGEVYGDHEAIGHTGTQPLVSHYNNQYDPVAGFALQFLRTGDPRWWHAISELATHVVDIDIYHTMRDKSAYNGGLFWHTYHYGDADTATHRTYPLRGKGKTHGGGPSADHNYPTGLMLHYLLTGCELSRAAAIGMAEYVLRIDDGKLSPFRWLSRSDTGRAIATAPAFYGPSRASGNSLNALIDGHRLTGDAKFLAKAEQLIRRVVHPSDTIAKNQLDEPEIRWFYAMFLQALGKYLHHRVEHGLVDDAYAYGQAALLHYARWMAVHEYPYLDKPEKLEFPTETWAAQDIRKSDIFCFAAMHADGSERARFLERAGFFHRNSVHTLSSMPTRTLARPVIVMLTSGFLLPWMEAHRDLRLPAGPTVDFGVPEHFVPQRAIAQKRAKMIAGAGVVAFLAAAACLVAMFW